MAHSFPTEDLNNNIKALQSIGGNERPLVNKQKHYNHYKAVRWKRNTLITVVVFSSASQEFTYFQIKIDEVYYTMRYAFDMNNFSIDLGMLSLQGIFIVSI